MEAFWLWVADKYVFLLVSGALLLIACIVYSKLAICDDLEDFFDEGGWLVILAGLAVAAIVYGFIYWIWWAMLIITVGVAALALIVAGVYVHYENSGYDNEDVDYIEDKKDEETTRYKCPNCGAAIVKYTSAAISYINAPIVIRLSIKKILNSSCLSTIGTVKRWKSK